MQASTHLLKDWEIVDFMNRKIAAANREIYSQLLASRAASAQPNVPSDAGEEEKAETTTPPEQAEARSGNHAAAHAQGGGEGDSGPEGSSAADTPPPDANEVANLVRVPTEKGEGSGQKTTVSGSVGAR